MEPKFFICRKCGDIVIKIKDGGCTPSCCGDPMEELTAGTVDAAREKHIPAVTVEGRKVFVTVGSVEHPMMEAHYIQWIFLQTKEGMQYKKLLPGQPPKAEFVLTEGDAAEAVYEYCNLHGLWKAVVE